MWTWSFSRFCVHWRKSRLTWKSIYWCWKASHFNFTWKLCSWRNSQLNADKYMWKEYCIDWGDWVNSWSLEQNALMGKNTSDGEHWTACQTKIVCLVYDDSILALCYGLCNGRSAKLQVSCRQSWVDLNMHVFVKDLNGQYLSWFLDFSFPLRIIVCQISNCLYGDLRSDTRF